MDIAYEVMFTAKERARKIRGRGFKKFSLTACSSQSVDENGIGFVPDGLGYISGIIEEGSTVKRIPIRAIEFKNGEDLLEKSICEIGCDGEDFSLWSHAKTKGTAIARYATSASLKSNPLMLYNARATAYGLFSKNLFMSNEIGAEVKDPRLRKRLVAIPKHMTEFQFSRFTDDANPVSTAICSDIVRVLLEEYDELSFIWSSVAYR